jgi:membrane protease YdiL (CAAX protease family)
MTRKQVQYAEFLVIFLLAPLLGLLPLPSLVKLSLLLLAAAYAHWRLKNEPVTEPAVATCRWWPGVLVRTGLFLLLAGGLVWWLMPEYFCRFPSQRPGFWLIVMVCYPVLSAWPQEILYRQFFFRRFDIPDRLALPVNAVLFAWLHIGYLNFPALVLSGAGGLILARQWRRHGSLTAVTVEHALYGMIIFTVGLGHYFYRGR